MYQKLCEVIERYFGRAKLLSLTEGISETSEALLQQILCASDARVLVEALLTADDMDIYWLIWDNAIWSVNHILNPKPRTEEMQRQFRLACEKHENMIYHVSPTVRTKRLYLSHMSEKDASFLIREILQKRDGENFVESLGHFAEKGRIFFTVKTEEGGDPIGYVGLTLLKYWGPLSSEDTCNLEYYMMPSHRKKGYLKEAAAKVVEMAFSGEIEVQEDDRHPHIWETRTLHTDMIKITCDVRNKASYHSALALGFEEEGIISLVREGSIYREYWFSKQNTCVGSKKFFPLHKH